MRIAFWFALAIVCCTPTDVKVALPEPVRSAAAHERRVCISPLFDQEDRQDIIYSITRWNLVSDRTSIWMTVVDDDCQWIIHRVIQGDEKDSCQVKNALACADMVGGSEIWVMRYRIESQFRLRGVILHEIAHIMGAYHSKSRKGLMNPNYSDFGYSFIDQETISEIARYNQR